MSFPIRIHFFCWGTLLLIILSVHELAGQMRGLGLEFNDSAYLQVPQLPVYNSGKADELPLKVDLTPFCPEPGNQGAIASCVGWACGYSALTTMLARQKNITDRAVIARMAMSALFVYNQIKRLDCMEGAKLDNGMSFLKTTGDIVAADFDTDLEDCQKTPDEDQLKRATACRMRDFVRLFAPDASWREKTFKVKQSLAAGNPVVIGMEITEGFLTLSEGQSYWDTNELPTPVGGHAMVVVGYNEAKKAFHILNSWGNTWGKKGFCWVKYEDFGKFCKYAYQGVLDNPEIPTGKIALQGSFAFQTPEFTSEDSLFFQPAKVVEKGQYYETEKTDWEVGQYYQLLVSGMPGDRYVYVFTIDPLKKAQIHFPEAGKVVAKSAMAPELELPSKRSDLIPAANAELVIPEPRINPDGSLDHQGLVKAHPGADYLCILYSNQRIESQELEKRIRNILLDESATDIVRQIEAAFQDILIPWSDIQYEKSNMRFTAESDKGFAVPVILRISGR